MGTSLHRFRTMIGKKSYSEPWPNLEIHEFGYLVVKFSSEEEALKRAALLFIKTYEHTKDNISFLSFETKRFAKAKCAVATIQHWWLVRLILEINFNF